MTFIKVCNKIIEYSLYALFFFVPLALASDTYELFEFNKMWVTFTLTIIIAASWFIKMIRQSRIFIQRTPLDIPIALFLLSQVISTIFSWDSHVSFWGYYSRFNGGLLSIISYIFLYYAFVSNFEFSQARGDTTGRAPDSAQLDERRGALAGGKVGAGPRATDAIVMVKRLLFVSLLSGLVVALWGLPSHFGYDPTCLLFRGTLDVSCWTADFQPKVRIFSTLGQPDWLAAYLAILLPIAIAFGIKNSKSEAKYRTVPGEARNSKPPPHPDPLPRGERERERVKRFEHLNFDQAKPENLFRVSIFGFWIFLLLSALFYLALLYTRARSGVIAAWASLAFFFIFYIWFQRKEIIQSFPNKLLLRYWYVLVVLVVFSTITFFVGQPFPQLDKFTLEGIKKNITSTQSTDKSSAGPPATQAEPAKALRAGEFGGTDSGTIRKIVWQGAIDAWRHYPFFGTGVETFAFAYYRFRPEVHNLTSEWNFLYNKAHNEYLNYLATTGAFGLGSYLLMIGWFIILSLKQFKIQNSKLKITVQNSKLERDKLLTLNSNFELCTLNFALLAGYISILVTNFFGFSVVITNIYLFMIPAFVFVVMGMIKPQKILVFPKISQAKTLPSFDYHITPWQWTFITLIIIIALYMLITLIRFWNADKSYSLGYNLDRATEYQKAYPHLQNAVTTRSDEPVFKDELAINSAIVAAALISQEGVKTSTTTASLANQLAEDSITLSNFLASKHPNNVVFWKSRVRIFYALSQVDPTYFSHALEAVKKAQALAPTDANISYNLGVLYGQNNDVKKGIETLENTIRLKPDYRDAYYALGLFYHDQAVDKDGKVINSALQKKAIGEMQYILDNIGKDDKAAKEALEQWKKL